MGLYNKILVTLDCSSVDKAIVSHIVQLAKIHHASVELLHIVHTQTLDQREYLMGKAESCMEENKKIFKKEGVEVSSIIKIGEPESEIYQVIEENNYDLIALATHGHHFFMDILYGSVSNSLKHKIDIPILLIKGKR